MPLVLQNQEKRFVLSLNYNGSNSFLFANAKKIDQSKTKDSEIKPFPLCLGNISKDSRIENMKIAGLCGSFRRAAPFVEHFMVLYNKIIFNQGLMY